MTNRNDLIGILSFIAVVTVIFTAVGLSVSDGVAGEGDASVPYEVAGQTITITGNITSADVINIDDATWAGITTVVVKDTVTSIADNSLSKATAVTKITIPASFKDSMAKIFGAGYDKATVEYKDADGMIDVYIGRGVTQIKSTYKGNSKVKSVFIPAEVESMTGAGVFADCTALTTVTFEKGSKITSIAAEAFSSCSALKSVTLPDKLTTIERAAFEDVKKIESIDFPDSLTNIGNYAFSGCKSLTSITLPESVTLNLNSFKNCTALKEVEFAGSGPKSIAPTAFAGCTALESEIIADGVLCNASPSEDGIYVVPEGVKEIIASAYQYRTNMTKITFSSTLETIAASSFVNCTKLETVEGLTANVEIKNNAFAGTPLKEALIIETTLVYVSEKASGESYTIPKEITKISDYAFANNTAIKSVKFECDATTLELGTYIFSKCTNLATVELPKGITFIYTGMFSGCTALKSFTIPSTVTNIYASAFASTGLEEITIPSTVTTMEKNAFQKCESLKKAVFEGSDIKFITQTSSGKTESSYIFSGCTSLTDVTLPSNLETIPTAMFSGCKALSTISIPTTVTEIGQSAFSGVAITELKLHEGLLVIGTNAFRECTKLTTVEIPSTCCPKTGTSWNAKGGLNSYTFYKSGAETGMNVTIHGNTYIGSYVFYNVKINELYLDGTPTIDSNAFKNATVGKIVVSGGVGFNCTSVNVIKDKIADGKLTVYTKNGEEYTEYSMIVSNSAADNTLTIGKDVFAIAPSVMKGTGLTGITVDPENKFFTLKDGALYFESNNTKADELEDATLITVLRGTTDSPVTDFVIPDGVKTVAPYAFAGSSTEMNTVTIGKSVKYLDSFSLTGIKAILIASEDSVPDYDAYVAGANGTVLFLSPNATCKIAEKYMYDVSTPALSFGGYYLKDGDSVLAVKIMEGTVKAISMSGTDSAKKVTITLNDDYAQSQKDMVVKEGWAITDKTPAITVNSDGTYSVTLDSTAPKMLTVTGVELNRYKITVADSPSYKVSFSVVNTDVVVLGTDVRFTVTVSDGYNGDKIAVKVGENTLEAVDGIYTFTITDNVTITISGITLGDRYTVTFDSNGGSDVAKQTIIPGYTAEFPANPTNGDKVFFGWYAEDELYDFASAVNGNITLKAKWISADTEKVKISVKAENGTVTARSLNDNSIITGEVYKGTTVSFVFTPKTTGYEVLSWKVGTATESTNAVVKTMTVDSNTEVYVSSVYSVSSFPYLETDIKTPVSGDTYKMAWKAKGTVGFNGMVYTPSILGDYVYAWSGNEIFKISLTDGTIVKKVDTGITVTGYYNLVTVGNGYVLAGLAGQVYDTDLNPVFRLYTDDSTYVTERKAYYNEGYFYIFTEKNVYKFKATDADPTTNNKQLPDVSNATKYQHYIASYQGQSNLIFTDKFVIGLEIGGESSEKRYAVTYDLETLNVIDSYEFTGLETANLNTGYISYYNGVFYLNTYSPGSSMFGTADGNWISLGTIELGDDGKFNQVTARYYDLGTTSYVSSFIVVGNYGYVNAGEVFKVYDVKTMECVNSIKSVMTHGNMTVSVQGDKVIAYIVPYKSTKTLYVFQHDQTTNTLTDVSLVDVLDTAQYGSQIVHFGPNGELIYYNDSGYLFCIQFGYKASFVTSDGTTTEDIAHYASDVTELPVLTKEWYSFDGWYAESDYSGAKITAIPKGERGDLVFYAKFTKMTSDDFVNGIKVSAFADNGKKALFQIESGKNVTSVSVVVGYSAYVTVAEGTFLCPTFTETFVTDVTNGVVDFTNKDGVRMESVSVFCCYEFGSLAYATTITSEFVPVMSSEAEVSADEGVTLMFDGVAVADGQTVAFGTYTVTVKGDESAVYSVNGTAVADGVKLFYSGQKLTVTKI